ncbi:MAG TPA: hypothetical protein VKB93_02270 [Thermoanaerobaculia bacterium]|nr:hypothetical protein [Thermoanaerobaculia bacterium]
MPSFAQTLRVINSMRDEGVIENYAVAGAMAVLFWAEPIPTYDLDLLVFLPSSGPILSLAPIYEWARRNDYPTEREHVIVEGTPVQFLPTHNELGDEAINTAAMKLYGGVSVRVVRPEYLIALYLEGSAKTPKRRERAAALRDLGIIDESLLQDVMTRFKLTF